MANVVSWRDKFKRLFSLQALPGWLVGLWRPLEWLIGKLSDFDTLRSHGGLMKVGLLAALSFLASPWGYLVSIVAGFGWLTFLILRPQGNPPDRQTKELVATNIASGGPIESALGRAFPNVVIQNANVVNIIERGPADYEATVRVHTQTIVLPLIESPSISAQATVIPPVRETGVTIKAPGDLAHYYARIVNLWNDVKDKEELFRMIKEYVDGHWIELIENKKHPMQPWIERTFPGETLVEEDVQEVQEQMTDAATAWRNALQRLIDLLHFKFDL
jgi:hypothetical protein